MNQFKIHANKYLDKETCAFYSVPYFGFEEQDNPDYLNILKNALDDFSEEELQSAAQELQRVLQDDLPQILSSVEFNEIVVCIVPRAKKAESSVIKNSEWWLLHGARGLNENQLLFRSTVQKVVSEISGLIDGAGYIRRHINTKTTHLISSEYKYKMRREYDNDGCKPYRGITKDTCEISPDVAGKDILLIDDIYTPDINVDEDAIQALYDKEAHTVTFYAVAKAGCDRP